MVPFECCIRLTAKCGSRTRIPLQPYEELFLTTATKKKRTVTLRFVYRPKPHTVHIGPYVFSCISILVLETSVVGSCVLLAKGSGGFRGLP